MRIMDRMRKIGLGSVQFGIPYGITNQNGQTSEAEVAAILKMASKNGIKYIDTASAYGTSEQVLGENNLEGFNIISKFMPDGNIKDQFEKSLSNLKVDTLYGYLAHRPMSLLEDKNQWEALKRLKEEGKVAKIGFSLNTPSELEMLLENKMQPDLIQVPYNYFDNRFQDLMVELKNDGCEIHSRSAFLQGLFFADTTKLSSFFDEMKYEIRALQQQFKENLSGALLNYVLSLDFVDVVIIGVENETQLRMNLNAINDNAELALHNFNFSESLLMPSNWLKS
jgi:aryl-alcohol dehydrogenase-like predicted oxidoreductase